MTLGIHPLVVECDPLLNTTMDECQVALGLSLGLCLGLPTISPFTNKVLFRKERLVISTKSLFKVNNGI